MKFDQFGSPSINSGLQTKRYYYPDGLIKYLCWNPRDSAELSDQDWIVKKATYAGGEEDRTQIIYNVAATSETVLDAYTDKWVI